MSATQSFQRLVERKGANVTFHRENGESSYFCPCRTKDGFRDPEKHRRVAEILLSSSGPDGTTIPAGHTAYYFIMPEITSFSAENGTDVIGPPAAFGMTAPETNSMNVSFDLRVPKLFFPFIQHIKIFRSIDDVSHLQEIASLSTDTTIWVDTVPISAGGVPANQIVPPVCNDDGVVPDVRERIVKGFVMPAYGGYRSRQSQILFEAFGDVHTDDHIGIFPLMYKGLPIDFELWSDSGSEWVEFNNMRFIAIAWNLIPAPDDADANHHWEIALRRINKDVTSVDVMP